MMGATIDELKFLEGIRNLKLSPAKELSFQKVIYNISGKTKKQVEDALNCEIRWLEDKNPTYGFKECRQAKPVNGSITFTIVFELVK